MIKPVSVGKEQEPVLDGCRQGSASFSCGAVDADLLCSSGYSPSPHPKVQRQQATTTVSRNDSVDPKVLTGRPTNQMNPQISKSKRCPSIYSARKRQKRRYQRRNSKTPAMMLAALAQDQMCRRGDATSTTATAPFVYLSPDSYFEAPSHPADFSLFSLVETRHRQKMMLLGIGLAEDDLQQPQPRQGGQNEEEMEVEGATTTAADQLANCVNLIDLSH